MSRSFDGVDDLITFGTTGDLLLTENSPVTCAAWILPITTGEGGAGVIFLRGNSITSPGIIFRAINTIRFRVAGTTDLVRASADNAITLGIWQHVAFTWDGSTTAANCHIYVNAVETGYQTTTNGVTPTDNSAENFRIGNLVAAHSFNGMMAYVHGYNRVLSVSEIQQLMRFPGSITRNLLLFAPLFGTSLPEPDYSGNRNNGTVTGAIQGATNPPCGRPFVQNRAKHFFLYWPSAAGQAYLQNVSDTITFSESITKQFLKHLVEPVTILESITKQVTKAMLESITVNESITKDFLKHLSEPLTYSESITKAMLKHLAETITLSEQITKDILKHLSESVTLSERITKDYTKSVSESVTISEAITKDYIKYVSDNFELTESITKDILKHISESYTLTESVTEQLGALVRVLTFLTVRGLISPEDELRMENDLIATAFTKSEKDKAEIDLSFTGLNKHDLDDMDKDSDSMEHEH